MKVIRILDAAETRLLSDLLNQMIVRELVASERSVTALARRLDSPVLKVWRRVQKLEASNLVEVSRAQKSGNVETKMYRATATSYVPQQFLDFRPRDPSLSEAFSIYSDLRRRITTSISDSNEIPDGVDPLDYSFYANMRAFVKVFGDPEMRKKVSALEGKLSGYSVPLLASTS